MQFCSKSHQNPSQISIKIIQYNKSTKGGDNHKIKKQISNLNTNNSNTNHTNNNTTKHK